MMQSSPSFDLRRFDLRRDPSLGRACGEVSAEVSCEPLFVLIVDVKCKSNGGAYSALDIAAAAAFLRLVDVGVLMGSTSNSSLLGLLTLRDSRGDRGDDSAEGSTVETLRFRPAIVAWVEGEAVVVGECWMGGSTKCSVAEVEVVSFATVSACDLAAAERVTR